MTGWRLFYYQFLKKIKCLEIKKKIVHKVILLTSSQNAAVVVMMILLGPTSSELTFSAFVISCSNCFYDS